MRGMRLLVLGFFVIACAVSGVAKTKQDKQAALRAKAQEILARLYKLRPESEAAIKNAAGYAVFSNGGVKILVAGGGKGQGICVDNSSQKITYMKMREVQAGIGMGAKKYSSIFVFQTKTALDSFVNSGWEFGAQTTAAAKTNDGGGSLQGAVAVSEGVWLYQLTEKGLALELTGKGTKYSKDDDLN